MTSSSPLGQSTHSGLGEGGGVTAWTSGLIGKSERDLAFGHRTKGQTTHVSKL